MSNKVVKDQVQDIEFGDFDNHGMMIPRELRGIHDICGSLSVHILWDYNDKTGRTIVLCDSDLENVDYESFGTTYEAELAKIGLKPEGVQVFGSGSYKSYRNITEKDGTIVPIEDFIVSYDVIHPSSGAVINHGSKEVRAQGPNRAIDRAKQLLGSYIHATNFKAISKN